MNTQYYMIAEEFPQIQFIMAHFGGYQNWTKPMDGIGLAGRYPNVYVETSQTPVKYLEVAAKELGPDKIIFGSNRPEEDSRVELYKIRLLKLPPAGEAKVF